MRNELPARLHAQKAELTLQGEFVRHGAAREVDKKKSTILICGMFSHQNDRVCEVHMHHISAF